MRRVGSLARARAKAEKLHVGMVRITYLRTVQDDRQWIRVLEEVIVSRVTN